MFWRSALSLFFFSIVRGFLRFTLFRQSFRLLVQSYVLISPENKFSGLHNLSLSKCNDLETNELCLWFPVISLRFCKALKITRL